MSQRITRLSRLAAAIIAAGLSLPAAARKVVALPAAAAGGAVPLPYVIRDNFGVSWDVQPDGTIGDGGDDLYDGAARLAVNDNGFAPQASAIFDPALNEVVFAPQQVGNVVVSRRVAVNAQAGWCRFTEIVQNPATVPVRAQLRLNFDLGGGVQTATPVSDPRKNTPIGIAIFDGRRSVAMLGGGHGGKVQCAYMSQPNTDQCDLVYTMDVPPRQSVAVVHFQAMRGSNEQAAEWMRSAREKDLLQGLPKEVRRVVANFRGADSNLSEIELPRTELSDIIELRGGDQYRGTLADASFKLRGFQGVIDLPADQVIGMINAGTYEPSQLFVTLTGEVVGGRLEGESLKMVLGSGQSIAVPLKQISRIGCRKRPGETGEFRFDKPMLFLRDGQRLGIELAAESLDVDTLYGKLSLPRESLALLAVSGEEQTFHRITLKDGSVLSALLPGKELEVRLRGPGGPKSPETTRVPLALIDRVQLVPSDVEMAEATAVLSLRNGDKLAANATGQIDLVTGFDQLQVSTAEVQSIRPLSIDDVETRRLPGEVTMTVWGGATMSGRIRQQTITFKFASGPSLEVPVTALVSYENPEPSAPTPMVEQIREIVARLSDPDWKKRERAALQLQSIGPSAAVVLTQMREGQSPETQKQIDTILNTLRAQKARATAPARPAALNKDDVFNKDDLLPR